MRKNIITTALFLIVTSIVLGAFGAHALEKVIKEADKLHTFEVGVRYQMYGGLGLLLLGVLYDYFPFSLKAVYRLQTIGILLFSLSIYGLVLTPLLGLKLKMVFGPLTPIGGLLLIIGWAVLLVKHLKSKYNE